MVAIFSRDRKQWFGRSISTLLLLLFALSITPKKLLHDLIVHHEDDINYHIANSPGFVKSGFHCDTDHNVAESPFASGDPLTISGPPVEFVSFNDAVNSSLHSITVFYFSLRGPPAIG
ncbi:hypothetical protein [Pseudoflavitalea rhizosphaerae]|uniref:hypothetical protein n=1 Tax=Pseudoflavitalea rhizosphaerae TaxID=1884793 RepID=UPI000F8DB872|nr:hypothetical protein [Pseudoflavitalea rhizosphaerae]